MRMGVVGIDIHGLKYLDGKVATKGNNPFSYIGYGDNVQETLVDCELLQPDGGRT